MLFPADTDLVRRDTALPGLGLVLDAEALGRRLAALWPEGGVREVRAGYLRYKPRTSCLVAYRVSGPEGERDIHAVARCAAAEPKLEKARARVRRGRTRNVVVLDDCAVVVSAFPDDASLPVLAPLADPERRRQLLRPLLGRDSSAAAMARLRYKPERRFVGRLGGGDAPEVVLKAHAAGGFEGALRGALASSDRGPLAVPRLRGALPEHGLLAFDWVPGRLLSETILCGDAHPAELEIVGEALAEIHAASAGGLLPRGPLAEAHDVIAVAAMLAFVQPEQAARAERFGREIAARLAAGRLAARPTHGDFHAGQVLLGAGAAAVLDFDEACLADPSSDLGSFIARLEWDSCSGRLPGDRVGKLRDHVLRGYARRAMRPADDSIALAVASALFRLTPHFFRDRDPAWPERTQAALDRVEAGLAEHAAARRSIGVSAPAPAAVRDDPGIPFLAAALDGAVAADALRRIPELHARVPGAVVESVRLVRHKPGRRCLIEYTLAPGEGAGAPMVVLGKVRARGADLATLRLVRSLHEHGFGDASEDGVRVPRPFGAVPELGMWVQARVAGRPATGLLEEAGALERAVRLADALHKLHCAPVVPGRAHTLAQELAALCDRLQRVARDEPAWAMRLARLGDACVVAAASAALPTSEAAVLHRDFHADQVLMEGDAVYLLDLDLCAAGDPALDAGNFAAHLVEQGLRSRGDPRALDAPRAAFVDRFLTRARRATADAVEVYTTLTLARHVWISTQLPGRRSTTAALLDLCEQRLEVGASTRKVTHAV